MSGGSRRDLQKERFWREVIEKREASGLTVREFCHNRALKEAKYYWWQRELRRRDSEAHGAGSIRGNLVPFVPVRIVQKESTANHAAGSGVDIFFSGTCRVRVEPGVDAPTLSLVVSVLDGRGC